MHSVNNAKAIFIMNHIFSHGGASSAIAGAAGFCFAAVLTLSCSGASDRGWVDNAVETARVQLKSTADTLRGTERFPRTIWSAWNLDFLADRKSVV